jgi:biopolymer transport protein ExbD
MQNHQHDDQCEKLKEKAREKKDPSWERADLDRDFVVVIKPTEEATYKNTVDILDEMTINGVKRFAMVKIAQSELDLVKATEGGQ